MLILLVPDKCNVVVLNWILSSLSRDVYLSHVFSDNAESVWKELQETYDRIVRSIVFNLLQKFNTFKQGGLHVYEHCYMLNTLWREFDILTKLPDCTYAARNELVDHGKLLKLMQFLTGLNDIYQPTRISLLTKKILPEVEDAFVIISRDESRKRIHPTSVKTDKPQVFALGNYDNLLCKNYGLTGHTVDRWFEVIGYPPGFIKNPILKPTDNFNNNKSNNADFKKENMGNNDSKTSAGIVSFTNE
nr:putative Gag-polypeptide of LTR copia-type [Tanacetum cinerariifolium]